jgi:hypothetical protein
VGFLGGRYFDDTLVVIGLAGTSLVTTVEDAAAAVAGTRAVDEGTFCSTEDCSAARTCGRGAGREAGSPVEEDADIDDFRLFA